MNQSKEDQKGIDFLSLLKPDDFCQPQNVFRRLNGQEKAGVRLGDLCFSGKIQEQIGQLMPDEVASIKFS